MSVIRKVQFSISRGKKVDRKKTKVGLDFRLMGVEENYSGGFLLENDAE